MSEAQGDLPVAIGRERLRRVGRAHEGAPLLVVVGALHGNEPAGLLGAERVLAALEADPSGLVGELVLMVGNRGALAQGRRYLDEDLNRVWTVERVEAIREAGGGELEQQELYEIDSRLHELLSEGPARRRYLVDLHTFSSQGPAFALLDDSLRNREFASAFGVPLILGLEEEVLGTLLDFLAPYPVTTVGFESGRHEASEAVDGAEAAVWVALEASGVLTQGARSEVAEARAHLKAGSKGLEALYDVRYRHPIVDGDGFLMREGFRGFQPVPEGGALADNRQGPVFAPEDSHVLMPLYQSQGEDGFFLVHPIHHFWLSVSRLLRRWRFDRWIHVLPGIRREPGPAEGLRVNRRVARWFALELLHLLGYRRQEETSGAFVMQRRDSRSVPFQ